LRVVDRNLAGQLTSPFAGRRANLPIAVGRRRETDDDGPRSFLTVCARSCGDQGQRSNDEQLCQHGVPSPGMKGGISAVLSPHLFLAPPDQPIAVSFPTVRQRSRSDPYGTQRRLSPALRRRTAPVSTT